MSSKVVYDKSISEMSKVYKYSSKQGVNVIVCKMSCYGNSEIVCKNNESNVMYESQMYIGMKWKKIKNTCTQKGVEN